MSSPSEKLKFDCETSSDESGLAIQVTDAHLKTSADRALALVPCATSVTQGSDGSFQILRTLVPAEEQLQPIYTSTIDWSQPIAEDDFLYRKELSQLRQTRQGITRLVIIDFDNTLFKSPLPNPWLWDSKVIGMLKSTDLGWFHDARTLSPPYLEYTDRHWISSVEELTRDECQRPDTLVMMLTGRSHAAYRQIILDLLGTRKDLEFDIVILKETPTRQSPLVSQVDFSTVSKDPLAPYTFDYKMAVVEDTIAAFPEIREIFMWDDRIQQCEKMQGYLDSLQSRSDQITKAWVYHVLPQTIYMQEDNERRLVNAMIQEYNDRVRASDTANCDKLADLDLPLGTVVQSEYPSFTGVFLDKKSTHLLKKNVRSPQNWAKSSRYMSLKVGLADDSELMSYIGAKMNDSVELVVDKIGSIGNRVIAVQVSSIKVQGKKTSIVPRTAEDSTPYITIAYNEPYGARADNASNITTWRPLNSGSLVLRGKVGVHMVTTAVIVKEEHPQQIPAEVSIGTIVCQCWPRLKGREIGVAVKGVNLLMEQHDIKNLEANREVITDLVRSLF
ncbi:hypothetical protein GGI07_002499 [Coemansia sp. Benny D115]|nr:hypothetical protein GGI07_002499 [Coemansia sp. Benny D115]